MQGNTFGQYLRALRKAKGFNLTGLSKISGVSHPYLSQIESGRKTPPTPDVIRKLSQALGVTHIGMMIKAGHVTEEEVLTFRREHGIFDHKEGRENEDGTAAESENGDR